MNKYKLSKFISMTAALFIIAVMLAGCAPASAPAAVSNPAGDLLRFTSGGHALVFSPASVMVASADHMLKASFIGPNKIAPSAETAASADNTADKATPLGSVTYKDIWDGVTLVYRASPGSIMESKYYLNSADDTGHIRLAYNRPLSLDSQGNLVIACESGNLVESAPVAWQEIGGGRKPVDASFVLYSEKELGFALGNYAPGIPVVIDPTLTWNTFLGGSGYDFSNGIAVDSSGNVYVTGETTATWGSPVRAFSGTWDAFVAKLDSSGNLTWNTFLGEGYGSAIALDGSGNVCVAGYDDATWGTPVRIYSGGMDGFAAKLNGATGTVIWNTFLGGSDFDLCYGIAVDGSGNVYVAGQSDDTWGSPVRPWYTYSNDAFAAKLDSSGNLIWNTFLGAMSGDCGYAIAVDGSGNAYVAGYSASTWGSPVRAHNASGDDAFVAKLDNSGNLTWNTFLGGNGDDSAYSIGLDGSGNIYVAGYGPATWGSPVRAFAGGDNDVFVAKLDRSGNLTWNTFLGGSGNDFGLAIAVDSSGNIYVGGQSDATWGSPWGSYSIGAFAAKLDNSGSLTWNTFLGGSANDGSDAIAVDGSGNVYVAGQSDSSWGSPVRKYSADMDGFAAKILSGSPVPTITSFTPTSGGSGTQVIITGTNFAGATSVSFGGTAASAFTVNSATQITATVGNGAPGHVTVTTPAGTATSTDNFNFFSWITLHGSSMSGVTAAPTEGPVSLPTVSVRSASLSSTKVAPGTPVTVTANVVNTGTVNGSTRVILYVNGQEESGQGVTVNSGSNMPVTFIISRNEPGTYSVYVGGAQAGSFTVDQFADPNMVLYISSALLIFAFILGVIYMTRRRQAH